MYAQVEKPKENKSRAISNIVNQRKEEGKQGIGVVNNRSESIRQKCLQMMMNGQRVTSYKNVIQRAIATVPNHIKAPTTPATMAVDRIPPRNEYTYNITVDKLTDEEEAVKASIQNNGSGNGTVTIDGSDTKELNNGTSNVKLKGTGQTDPGNVGNLKLQIKQGTTLLDASSGFSVAAVPEKWSVAYHSDIVELSGKRGMKVTNSWKSDSGNVSDLDEVDRKETVEEQAATGNQVKSGSRSSSSWREAKTGSIIDKHTITSGSIQRGEGTKSVHQGFVFKDARTGVTGIIANESGFEIKREITGTPGTSVTFTKKGANVTVNSVDFTAGSGNASKTLSA